MKKQNLILGLSLIGLSIVLHTVHFMVFKDMHHIMIFLFADIAFIPLEVFFVSLILERLISKQEEENILKKMHMLVGLFYQKFGDDLLKSFVMASDETVNTAEIAMDYKWTKKDYSTLKLRIKKRPHILNPDKVDLYETYKILKDNEQLMINLISNPTLQENDTFSDLLLATFHLHDELGSRNLDQLHKEDYKHLIIDCERIYKLLSVQWVDYMEHLQMSYPYLFLTAAINNPYDNRSEKDITKQLMHSRP